MNRIHLKALLLWTLAILSGAVSAAEPLVMGVFPRRNAVTTHEMFEPFAAHLSRQLGRTVVLETAKDFATFWQGVEGRRYDIVHFNQYHYLRAHQQHAYQAIVRNVEHGSPNSSGALFVRQQSGINYLFQLKGKRVIFGGGRDAMQSYIITTHLLRQAGLKEGDYQELFARNPINAVLAVAQGEAEAAGAGEGVLTFPALRRMTDPTAFSMLARGPRLPHIPWAVKGEMAEGLRERVQQLMLGLDRDLDGVKLLLGMRIEGFVTARDSDFDPHRALVDEVLGERY